jgi:phytoene dehydrogenase-like protein
MVPLHRAATASFALVLATAGHAGGWPLALGGSQSITRALVSCLRELGGEIQLATSVRSIDELPRARAYLFDVTPRQLLEMGGIELPVSYRKRLARFRYGPGVFKIDWALRAPIPWRHSACARAATVHLAGSMDQVAKAESGVHEGRVCAQPFTLLVQPSLFDPSRAPVGAHTAWAYCHVPAGDRTEMTGAIENQIERHAPGFRSLVLARSTRDTAALQDYNPNYVGGDINGGLADLGQLLFRPVVSFDPYATPVEGVFLCSSSTPPGGGVHGMCGYWAARSALRRVFRHHRKA